MVAFLHLLCDAGNSSPKPSFREAPGGGCRPDTLGLRLPGTVPGSEEAEGASRDHPVSDGGEA